MNERPQLTRPESGQSFAAVRARVLFFLSLFGFAAGPLLLAGSLVFARLDFAAWGAVILAAAWGLRHWLRQRGEWDSAAADFDAIADMPAVAADGPEARFIELLEQRDALETRRGSPGFDPWALQVVRRNIQAAVDQDAALARIFHNHERQKRMS